MAKRKAKVSSAAVSAEVPEAPVAAEVAVAPAPAAGKRRQNAGSPPPPPPGTDLLSQTVLLCQEQRWREAAQVCRRVVERARGDGNADLEQSMSAALTKIEYSLRRQMVAAAVEATRNLLAKEFLLDVGA